MSDEEEGAGPRTYGELTIPDRGGVEFRIPILSRMELLGWQTFLGMRDERRRVFDLVCVRNRVPLRIGRAIFDRLWRIE